jgi:hypothetical protein
MQSRKCSPNIHAQSQARAAIRSSNRYFAILGLITIAVRLRQGCQQMQGTLLSNTGNWVYDVLYGSAWNRR